MTTITETQYLNEIKFRNAVKRAVPGRVLGKNEYGSYSTRIKATETENVFTVEWLGGNTPSFEQSEKAVLIAQRLHLAGFEAVEVQQRAPITLKLETVIGYRKAA